MGHTTTATLLLGWAVVAVFSQNFVNVALDKSYDQSSTGGAQAEANAAANGDTEGDYSANCMRSKSDESGQPWYEVNLGRVYPVYNIDIWSRTNYQHKLYTSTITVDGETCTTVTGPWEGRQKSVTCSDIMYGRSVRVTLDRESWMCMCEIQIWVPEEVSQCPAGLYDQSCASDCNDNCAGGSGKNFCDMMSGNCYEECVAGWHGNQCSEACPNGCRNTGCDRGTGECDACDTGYRGDNCADCADTYYRTSDGSCMECSSDCLEQTCADGTGQCHVNVALGKTYSQSSKSRASVPDNAGANGDTVQDYANNCMKTNDNDDYAWYQVKLDRVYPVYNIDIWSRTGYLNRLYPSTITVNGDICASNISKPSSGRRQSVTCSEVMYGNKVRVTLDKTDTSLNLCEIQIWVPDEVSECPAGKYGSSCGSDCSDNCGDGTEHNFCDQQSAHCYDGCDAGWHGDQCSMLCPHGCRNTGCTRDQGECGSCDAFYTGDNCADCVVGYYKPNNQECLECPEQKYGQNCAEDCGHCASDAPCDHQTGHCAAGGCADGWKATDRCKTECDDGTWGPACNNVCGQCKEDAACHKVTGHCTQCELGLYQPLCVTSCLDGHYGDNCTVQCGSCLDDVICNKATGHCPVCAIGKQPPLCATDCHGGRYGQNCSGTCGQCRGQPCDPMTGNCSEGCAPGWTDPESSTDRFCKTECPDGTYGAGCTHSCGQCRAISECRHDTGHCTGPCADGYQGDLCAEPVTDSGGGSNTGAIVGAVVAVVLGIAIVIIVVIFVLRRRRGNQKAGEERTAAEWSNERGSTTAQTQSEHPGPGALSFTSIVSNGSDKKGKKNKKDKKLESQDTSAVRPVLNPTEAGIYQNVPITEKNPASEPSAGPSEKKSKTVAEQLTDDEKLDMMCKEEDIYANEELRDSFHPSSMPVDQLFQAIVSRLKDGTTQKEFALLVGVQDYPVTNGKRKENYYKNRFNSILPYDQNRVVLEQMGGDESSDYINASFVKGVDSEKAYIAAQGPRPNTVDEWWRMVWQEGVTDIVMLTNTKEGHKKKCHEYWPANGESLKTEHMEVTGLDEEHRAHFIIRTFNVKQLQGPDSRGVKQYHYISWMDHEVPTTTHLVNFWRYVKARAPRSNTAPPLLVHCSAGVGRTGTYIGLDLLVEQSLHQPDLCVFTTVSNMRQCRPYMVQNKNQYEFLYEAVLEGQMCGDSRLDTAAFDRLFPTIIQPQMPHPTIDTEFQRLCQMRTCFTQPSHTVANLEENRLKNRNLQALPDDKHLVYITKHSPGRNQYINAVTMPTFLHARGSVVTQLPLADTVLDLWRLVDSWRVSTIVSIGPVSEDEAECIYWPRSPQSPLKCGSYSISLKSSSTMGHGLNSYNLTLSNAQESREVRALQYEAWSGEVVDDVSDLLLLMDTLTTGLGTPTPNPVLIQCTDGVAQSGALCALWDVISRLTSDGDVDVYLAVRHVNSVRPEAVSSLAQYRFIYKVVQQFNSSENVYANS